MEHVSLQEVKLENFNYIARTPLTAFNSYFPLIGIFGIYKLVTAENIPTSGIIAILFVILMCFLLGLIGIGKVGFSNKFMAIKYYYFPIENLFRLKDIQGVFIEFPGGNSSVNAIRVVTNDGKQKSFKFSNYLKKDWLRLEELLIDKNIKVTNTLYKTIKNTKHNIIGFKAQLSLKKEAVGPKLTASFN